MANVMSRFSTSVVPIPVCIGLTPRCNSATEAAPIRPNTAPDAPPVSAFGDSSTAPHEPPTSDAR